MRRRIERLERRPRPLRPVHVIGPIECDEDDDALIAEAIASGRARPGSLFIVRRVIDPVPGAFDDIDGA